MPASTADLSTALNAMPHSSSSTLAPPIPSIPTVSPDRLSLPLRNGSPIELGRGAFGLVFAALLDRACPVAVKVLRPGTGVGGGREDVGIRQFRREVRRYASLMGVPGVARFYGVSWGIGGVELLVTERLRGGSLKDVMRRGGLDVKGGLRVGHVIANALAEIHRRGFSHGDVKPGNVLFGESVGESGHLGEHVDVRMVDFGLSRSFRGVLDEVEADEPESIGGRVESIIGGEARGTPAYLSPEAWGGREVLRERVVAEKADIYALGMILYEIETCRVPWGEYAEWGIFCAVVNEGERPEWAGTERVEGIRNLISKCWAQEFSERPSASEVADELLKMRDGFGYGGEEGHVGEQGVPESPRVGETLPLLSYISELDVLDVGPSLISRHIDDELDEEEARETIAESIENVGDTVNGSVANRMQRTSGSYHGANGSLVMEEEVAEVVSVNILPRGPTVSSSGRSPRSRDVSVGLSTEEASTNGGYEADGHSQPRLQSSDHTMDSLRSTEEVSNEHHSEQNAREGANSSKPGDQVGVPIVVPETVQNLQYAFKEEVMNNDCHALCKALGDSEKKPLEASRVLEAVSVLVAKDVRNCEHFVECGGMRMLSAILSRYGNKDVRLSKAACVVVGNMALCASSNVVERELRTTGACEIVLNAVRFHPANLPVVQNAAGAIVVLCQTSPALCSIVLALGGINSALRVVARGSNSFRQDVLVAADGLEILSILAQAHTTAVAEGDVISKVLRACDSFRDKKIDEQCLKILLCVTRHATGQEVMLSAHGSMSVLSLLIDRLSGTGSDQAKLRDICDMMSGLARVQKRSLARNAFLASNAVESVVQSVKSCAEPSTENEVDVLNADSVAMAIAGLECFTSMTGLGMDVCGAMQMAQVFSVTRSVLTLYPTNRTIALRAVTFLESILKELRTSSFVAHSDIVLEMLVQMKHRWRIDQTILHRVEEARRVLQETSTKEKNGRRRSNSNDDGLEREDSHHSTLRIFSRMKSARS